MNNKNSKFVSTFTIGGLGICLQGTQNSVYKKQTRGRPRPSPVSPDRHSSVKVNDVFSLARHPTAMIFRWTITSISVGQEF